jgi:predicted nucleotidyltransferase
VSASTGSVHKKFTEALDELVAQVKQDRSILAAILCGSLSHDAVWAKSDIDLALITVDDRKLDSSHVSLYAAGVNVHAFLMARAEFRKSVEGALRNSFIHSLLAKGRLLYTHDETIARLCATLHEIGERDTQVQLLAAATRALGPMDKARKWFVTRGDLDYTALWILYAATALAQIEVIGARLLADREVIPQALKLNPVLFKTVYSDLLNTRKTRRNVQAALDAADDYLARRAPELFRLVLDHLREVGEARSCTEIENHFRRNFTIEGVSIACEYLADRGLLGKASTPVQLTKRSNVVLQELAFVDIKDAPDGF